MRARYPSAQVPKATFECLAVNHARHVCQEDNDRRRGANLDSDFFNFLAMNSLRARAVQIEVIFFGKNRAIWPNE